VPQYELAVVEWDTIALTLMHLQELGGTPLQRTYHSSNEPDVNATDEVIALVLGWWFAQY
jgi:hypothetical protein